MIFKDDTGFPPGTIVVAASMQPRFYEFLMSMERLLVPSGTRYLLSRGCDITHNFNDGIQKASGDWIWFMGDDHSFAPDMLLKLLAHRVSIVIPPTSCKIIPWLPCIMHGNGTLTSWKSSMPLYTWAELSHKKLFALPVGDFIGQAGMLVSRAVFNDWPYPWFKAGQQDPGLLQEDMTFCRELQARGNTIYIDAGQILDHWSICGITTRFHNGEYVPGLIWGDEVVTLPDALADRQPDGSTRLRRAVPFDINNGSPQPFPSRIPAGLEDV